MTEDDQRLTKDIDENFWPGLAAVCLALSTEDSDVSPADMLQVMFSESQCRANAHNDNPKSLPPEKRYNASGLIQFMPYTLQGLGWTAGHEAFRRLTATEQLHWVQRYFTPYRGYLHSVGGIYTATFLPALVKHANDPAYVLVATAESKMAPRLSWAYAPNSVFDVNKDHEITVGELEEAVARNCKGQRWNQLASRLAGYGLSQTSECGTE